MEPIDWEALRENCAGDEALVVEVLELFRKEAPGLLIDIGAAVSKGDPVAIKHTAHRLKGALASLAAGPCATTSRELELMGMKGELNQAAQMFGQLEREMQQLLTVLTAKAAAPAAGPTVRA